MSVTGRSGFWGRQELLARAQNGQRGLPESWIGATGKAKQHDFFGGLGGLIICRQISQVPSQRNAKFPEHIQGFWLPFPSYPSANGGLVTPQLFGYLGAGFA